MKHDLSPTQTALVKAAAKENDFHQAWFLWRLAGLPGHASGCEVVRLIKPTGLFASRMGGAQVLVWKLTEEGRAVASAIEARSDATGTGAAEGESAAPSGETPHG